MRDILLRWRCSLGRYCVCKTHYTLAVKAHPADYGIVHHTQLMHTSASVLGKGGGGGAGACECKCCSEAKGQQEKLPDADVENMSADEMQAIS